MQQPQRRQRRGRRRRGTYEETIAPIDATAMQDTDLIRVNSGSTVKDVAEYLGVAVPEIIKKLMTLGEMATLTQTLSDEAIQVLAEEVPQADRDRARVGRRRGGTDLRRCRGGSVEGRRW